MPWPRQRAVTKYRAKRTTLYGVEFASKKEAARYGELLILKQIGKIKDLELQPRFELQPTFKKNGVTHRSITYVADFKYWDNDLGKIVVEDVKGMCTEVWKIKMKIFEFKYPDLHLTII